MQRSNYTDVYLIKLYLIVKLSLHHWQKLGAPGVICTDNVNIFMTLLNSGFTSWVHHSNWQIKWQFLICDIKWWLHYKKKNLNNIMGFCVTIVSISWWTAWGRGPFQYKLKLANKQNIQRSTLVFVMFAVNHLVTKYVLEVIKCRNGHQCCNLWNIW